MLQPRNVLVTGCSSGIGYELLRLLPEAGFVVAGTALPGSYDQAVASPHAQNPRVRLYPLDVTDYQAASDLVRAVTSELGPIDILINNAGICYRAVAEDMSPADELRQMQVNYLGPMHLIRQCLPSMRQRRSGRIINVSSVGGMMAMPTMASYSASKFALEGASEALWYELRPWNISVSLVRPGFINSLAFTKVQTSKPRSEGKTPPDYEPHYLHMTRFVEKAMRRTPCTSLTVAKRIVRLAQSRRPPLRVSATPDAWLFHCFRRATLRPLYHQILYRCLPGIKTWGRQPPA